MDRQRCKQIRAIIEDKLNDAIPDCLIKIGRMTYSDTNVKVTVEVAELKEGKAQTQERQDYIKHAKSSWTQLQPEWLDLTVKDNGDTYEIVGYRYRNRKYPVVIKKNGQRRKATEDMVVKVYSNR